MGWVALVVVVLVVAWLVFTYNGLISARNRTQEAWSEIDVELKRRHDLIPNLVNTVQGYMGHERGTLEAVTNARANAVAAGATGDPAKIGQAENILTQSLRSLFAVSENYPDLAQSDSNLVRYVCTAAASSVSMSSSWLTPSPLRVQFAEPSTSSASNSPTLACSSTPFGTGYQRTSTPPARSTAFACRL